MFSSHVDGEGTKRAVEKGELEGAFDGEAEERDMERWFFFFGGEATCSITTVSSRTN